VLAAERRTALLQWLRDHDAIAIEDDYDAEYRYDRAAVGALQGLEPERIVYAGSASKTLAPALRLGWIVVPARHLEPIRQEKYLADQGTARIEQRAFANFIARGELDRHLRRMRPVYRRRRDALLDALRDRLPDFEPTGIAAGQHLVAWLPADLDEATVVGAAARRGVGVYGVAPYRIGSKGPGGLIFGYATLSERMIAEGIEILAGVVAELRGQKDH
jgi:GntR family transcriptional regulator/MocR family aminotransferase